MSATIERTISEALRLNVPFAAWSLPGSAEVRFVANPSYGTDADRQRTGTPGAVTISEFGHDSQESVILPELDREEFNIASAKGDIRPREEIPSYIDRMIPTPRAVHLAQVIMLTDRLRHASPGSKTVLSRIITGCIAEQTWEGTIRRIFIDHPDTSTFRFAFLTPETGAWLGLSPELLLRQTPDGTVTSMALAGSRPAGTGGDWDRKNIAEHQPVVDHILKEFRNAGLSPELSESETAVHGAVEHLRHTISASGASPATFNRLLKALNPTPALAGWPVERALQDIARTELHTRGCYGGYIAVNEPDGTLAAYVNLRSMRISGQDFCIFVGGGITAASNPDAEWDETEAKARQILGKLGKSELRPQSCIL